MYIIYISVPNIKTKQTLNILTYITDYSKVPYTTHPNSQILQRDSNLSSLNKQRTHIDPRQPRLSPVDGYMSKSAEPSQFLCHETGKNFF